jgi:PAS domain S-box-containing protein
VTSTARLAASDASFGDLGGEFTAPALVAADNHLDDSTFETEDAVRAAWEAEHARRVMEATTEGVLIISASGVCEYLNDAGERLLGYSREDVVGTDIHSLLHPAGEHPCVFAQPLQMALPCARAEVFRTARGSLLAVDVTASPSLHEGQVASVVCMFSDATARLLAEQQRHELLAAKEAAVTRLEELNAQQRDFVSTVSHELRTPLTSIMGFLDMVLEDETLGEEVRDHLNVVDRNAKRLLAQVEALLLVSRIESGKITAHLVPVDPMTVVSDVVTAITPQANGKGVSLSVAADENVGWVNADPSQLDRVLLNLLSNAVKFTPTGGKVDVSVTGAGQWVQVQVRDTGMGIPKAEQHRLFEKFFRSTISQKQATPGTGLGLTIVRAIVQEHGGQVRVVSEEGVGTAVAFTLPRTPRPD